MTDFFGTPACTLRYGIDMVMFGSFLRWVLHLGHSFGLSCAADIVYLVFV